MSARIGLEVHLYVAARSKLFCACRGDFLAFERPNANVCPTCSGQPGATPRAPNTAALVAGVRLARALGCAWQPRASFLRKHYFYPDSPTNYQRTSTPLARGGVLADASLTELHVEEDPGALDPATGRVDLNRAGAPLLELVTEPDIASPAHARRFLQELRLVLSYLDIAYVAAGTKVDCNLSLAGGERVEIKNVQGVRNVERALAGELARQEEALARGSPVRRETRAFDEATGATTSSRDKESEADYRFLEDPDLPPMDLARIAADVPMEEAPLARRARFATRLGVPVGEASALVEERALADLFEAAAARAQPKTAYGFIVRDLRGELDHRSTTLAKTPVAQDALVDLIVALDREAIMPHVATRLLRAALDGDDLARRLDDETRQGRATTDDVLVDAVRNTLAQHPKAVADHAAGKSAAVQFLVGQTLRALQGRADAQAVRRAIEAALREGRG